MVNLPTYTELPPNYSELEPNEAISFLQPVIDVHAFGHSSV